MSTTSKPSIDDQVMNLFNLVRTRQQAIQASEKPRWVTTCTIGTSDSSVTDRINIQTVIDPNKLLDIFGFLLQREEAVGRAATLLGVKAPPFKWMGYMVPEWGADIKTRLNQIELTAKRAELKTLEARLDKLISQDQRRELELAAIQRELAGQA